MAAGRSVLLLLLSLLCELDDSEARRCICLAVDTTVSMATEIATLKQELPSIISRRKMEGTAPIVYTLVPFNDPGEALYLY